MPKEHSRRKRRIRFCLTDRVRSENARSEDAVPQVLKDDEFSPEKEFDKLRDDLKRNINQRCTNDQEDVRPISSEVKNSQSQSALAKYRHHQLGSYSSLKDNRNKNQILTTLESSEIQPSQHKDLDPNPLKMTPFHVRDNDPALQNLLLKWDQKIKEIAIIWDHDTNEVTNLGNINFTKVDEPVDHGAEKSGLEDKKVFTLSDCDDKELAELREANQIWNQGINKIAALSKREMNGVKCLPNRVVSGLIDNDIDPISPLSAIQPIPGISNEDLLSIPDDYQDAMDDHLLQTDYVLRSPIEDSSIEQKFAALKLHD